MERAVQDFLRAAAVPQDPELAQTPERVAAAWLDELLDGYRSSPAEALGELLPSPGGNLVCVTHVDYTGLCPHHLLPYRGIAHIAYLPDRFIAGFGRFPTLVDALAHRLTLQERLAQQIADALVNVLKARGAGVVLQAEQACMTLRGERRVHSRATVEATAGQFGAAELARLWSAIGEPPPGHSAELSR
jgi:GTP cyclohydrolase I